MTGQVNAVTKSDQLNSATAMVTASLINSQPVLMAVDTLAHASFSPSRMPWMSSAALAVASWMPPQLKYHAAASNPTAPITNPIGLIRKPIAPAITPKSGISGSNTAASPVICRIKRCVSGDKLRNHSMMPVMAGTTCPIRICSSCVKAPMIAGMAALARSSSASDAGAIATTSRRQIALERSPKVAYFSFRLSVAPATSPKAPSTMAI